MSGNDRRLDDPRLSERLRAACRRTGLVRSNAASAPGQSWAAPFARPFASFWIAMSGLLVKDLPSGIHLLVAWGIVTAALRARRMDEALTTAGDLAVLARLPACDRQILDFQLRPFRRSAAWAMLDGAGFWTFAWAASAHHPSWVCLPLLAGTHAAITMAMSWVLFGSRFPSGILLVLAAIVGFGAVNHRAMPGLWAVVSPMLTTATWSTPWGWAALLAPRLADSPLAGLGVCALLIAALIGGHHLRRMRSTRWRLPAVWREAEDRAHTWTMDAPMPADDRPPAAAPDDHGAHDHAAADIRDASDRQAAEDRAHAALRQARAAPSGASLDGMGQAGRIAAQWSDTDDRRLADALAPQNPGSTPWALVLAAVAAGGALLGLPPAWTPVALALVLAVRGWFVLALVAGAFAAYAHLQPETATTLGVFMPCALALLLGIPLFGGSYGGVSQSGTPLGGLPRTWWRMVRLMTLLLLLRHLLGLPVVLLALVAIGCASDATAAWIIAACWVLVVLLSPWLSALQLTAGNAHGTLGLGRWWLTCLHILLLLAMAVAGILLAVGIAALRNRGDDRGPPVDIAICLTVCVAVTASATLLLRHAYRRTVDLVPAPATV